MKEVNKQDLIKATQKVENIILSLRNEKGVWEGKLSGSALSTAVAVFALWSYDKTLYKEQIFSGLNWLKENINKDGAWGDTEKSQSNLSTTLLCWSAFTIVKGDIEYKDTINRTENWLKDKLVSLEPEKISSSILNHYKTDRTFSVPILTMCALSGRLGKSGWKYVPQLPFQMAALPDKFFSILNLSVVSYAVPALIAMGLVKSKKSKTNFFISGLNKLVKNKVLKVLGKKQPYNGGFLEATPLTAFVLMSMIGAGEINNPVCLKAVKFLTTSIRPDGSWPIDTNLSTWVTTLAVNSISEIEETSKKSIYKWLINQQYKTIHPFTKAKPGGWAWTDLPGGVPDGDDTSGAILAIAKLDKRNSVHEAKAGIEWLLGIQNKDGGFPTFCKGWGKLPFDCSCPDITAHAIKAFATWRNNIDNDFAEKIDKSISKAVKYLRSVQRNDGSWLPLWFGNENDENHLNPVYGTSQVLFGLCEAKKLGISDLDEIIKQGSEFIIKVKNKEGAWGGNTNVKSSIEETALAVRALAVSNKKNDLVSGVNWLLKRTENWDKKLPDASPIGLYFASLWYYEDMYPLVFTCSALNEVKRMYFEGIYENKRQI